MHLTWVLISSLILSSLILADNTNNGSMPFYLLKLQQLREAAAEEPLNKNIKTNGKKKTRRYKCVLMDEDDEAFVGENVEQNYFKVIPHDSDTEVTTMNPYSFASEVKQEAHANLEDDGQYFYLSSTTPISINSPITIKKLEKSDPKISSAVQEHITVEKIHSVNDVKPARLPVAQGIPLRKIIQTSSANVLLSENLKHVETPSSLVESTLEVHKIIQQQEPLQNVQQRRRYIATTVPTKQLNEHLVLSEEHCRTIMHYASLYNVKDIKGWVHHNCAFAKMYLPNATCAEIDVLVASCFK